MGPRRAGKSFFVLHTLNQLGKFGYVNFDNEALIQLTNYNDLIAEVMQVFDNPTLLFFDEIQNLPNWELFVSRLQREGYNIVITGSNSKLLSKELASHLTGRHIPTTLLPFSFSEYLRATQQNFKELTTQQQQTMLLAYLESGGYPETITKKLKAPQYLSILFDSIIFKDIIKRHNIRKGPGIERLAVYLLSNVASEISYLSLANATGLASSLTAQRYCGFLEEAYLVFPITRFTYKTKLAGQNRKIYCYDNGLIAAKTYQSSPNYGRLFENCIAVQLKRMDIERKIQVYYWRSPQGEEVDFVIKKGTQVVELIQACYTIESAKTHNREIRSLLKASKELQCNNLTILTLHQNDTKEKEWFGIKRKICYTPLSKWLLEENSKYGD
jgi:predicted AAA+ superfamily ATPase